MPDDDSSNQRDSDPARTTTIVLAEFAALRGEVATRLNLQVTLMLANLTVLGVVLGIALSRPDNRNVLLVLPLVTPCIGVLVIDSFRNLDLLGQYIHRFIRPHLQITSQRKIEGVEVFGWEQWIAGQHFKWWLFGPYQFVLFAEFLGPPITILTYAHAPVSTLQRWLWWAGAVLTGSLLVYAVSYGAYTLLSSKGSMKIRKSSPGDQNAEGVQDQTGRESA